MVFVEFGNELFKLNKEFEVAEGDEEDAGEEEEVELAVAQGAVLVQLALLDRPLEDVDQSELERDRTALELAVVVVVRLGCVFRLGPLAHGDRSFEEL